MVILYHTCRVNLRPIVQSFIIYTYEDLTWKRILQENDTSTSQTGGVGHVSPNGHSFHIMCTTRTSQFPQQVHTCQTDHKTDRNHHRQPRPGIF
jgi:hypothetical protein